MVVSTPDWLSQHSGELRPSKDGRSVTVYFDGQPQYILQPVPARGSLSCQVSQTINGKRLDSGATYKMPEEAVRGGLEELRAALGW